MVSYSLDNVPAHVRECVHDVRLVFAFAKLGDKKWYVAAVLSWGIALFEYLFQVPANRAGYAALSLPQLKVVQEVITLSVFVPYAILYMHQAVKMNYVWAGLCLLGSVYFMFRS